MQVIENISREIVSKVNQKKQKLETLLNSEIYKLSVRDNFGKINNLIIEIQNADNNEEKAQKSD